MELLLRRKRTILAFLLPALLLYVFIALIPIAQTVYYSFFKLTLAGNKSYIALQNYIFMFKNDEIFSGSILNTFKLMLMSVFIQMPLAFLIALALSRNPKGKSLYKTIYFMPYIISGVAVGVVWYFIYHVDYGIVNSFLSLLGLDGFTKPWLADEKTVMWAIILVVCWQNTGYHMILFIAAIENIPLSFYEASKIDGAGFWQHVRYILIPLIKPVFKIDLVLICIGSLRYFDLIFVMTEGGPNHASEVMATYIYNVAFTRMDYGYGSTLSVVLLIMCLLITLILNKVFKSDPVEW